LGGESLRAAGFSTSPTPERPHHGRSLVRPAHAKAHSSRCAGLLAGETTAQQLTSDTDKYDAAITKCETKYQPAWQKVEQKAQAASSSCPTTVVGSSTVVDILYYVPGQSDRHVRRALRRRRRERRH
jgi:hypothetical protein